MEPLKFVPETVIADFGLPIAVMTVDLYHPHARDLLAHFDAMANESRWDFLSVRAGRLVEWARPELKGCIVCELRFRRDARQWSIVVLHPSLARVPAGAETPTMSLFRERHALPG